MLERVAFAGRMRVGKTTAATHASKLYGHRVCSFATPLKMVAREVFGVDPEDKERNRTLLQAIGDKLREIDPDVFVKACARSIEGVQRVAIDDLRFPNEEAWARSAGFAIVLIIRPNAPSGPGAEHHSESYVDSMSPDFTLVNDGTLEEFLDLVARAVAEPPPRGSVLHASRAGPGGPL